MNIRMIQEKLHAINIHAAQHEESVISLLRGTPHHVDIDDYVTWCLPERDILASGVYVFGPRSILEINLRADSWRDTFSFGFLAIAGTFGGNVHCVDCKTGAVYFADHALIGEDQVDFFDCADKTYKSAKGLSYNNIHKSLICISNGIEDYLLNTLDNGRKIFYGQLDSGEYIRKIRESGNKESE